MIRINRFLVLVTLVCNMLHCGQRKIHVDHCGSQNVYMYKNTKRTNNGVYTGFSCFCNDHNALFLF